MEPFVSRILIIITIIIMSSMMSKGLCSCFISLDGTYDYKW